MLTNRRMPSQLQRAVYWFVFAAVMAGFLLATPQILRSAEAGGATIQFQFNNNSTATSSNLINNPLFSLAIPGLSTADFRVDSYEYVPNWGLLKTSFDVANTNNTLQPTRGFLQLSDYHLGNWKFDITAGDQPLGVYNIDFGLNSLFNPFAYLRGGQVTASTDRVSITAFDGRVATMNGFFGESLRFGEENIMGVRGIFSPSSKLKLGASLVRTSAPDNSTDIMVPQSDTIATLDALYQLTSHIQLVGQSSISKFSASPASGQASGMDFSYLGGFKVKGVRGNAEVTWQKLGTDYLPLSFFNLGDREGVFSSADYQVNHSISLYGAFNRYRNNLVDSSLQSTLNVLNEFIGARYILRPHTTLNFRIGNASVESQKQSPNFVFSHSRTLDLELLQQIGTWRALLRYSDGRDFDFTNGFEHGLRQRLELEVRKQWQNGTNLWVSGGTLRENQQQPQVQGHTTLVGGAGFNWTVRPTLSFYSEFNLNKDVSVVRTSSFNTTSFNSGVNWALPHGIQFSMNGQYNRSTNKMNLLDFYTVTPDNLNDLQNLLLMQQFNRYQFTFRIQKTFKWGERPQEIVSRDSGASALAGRPHEFGNIAGVVYNDLDRNGVKNDSEVGITNVTIILDAKVRVQVDDQGRFEYKNVPAGKHTIELDLLTLPATYDPGANTRVAVTVTKRSTSNVQFPLVQLGKVSGKVVLVNGMDSNTLRKEIGESKVTELPGANIIMLLNETYKVTFTDSDGDFEFSNIPSGEYRVRIDHGTLPEFSTVDSDEVQVIKIAPGGKVSDLKFVVKLNPRPNRKLLVASQTMPPAVNGNGKAKPSVSALAGGETPSVEEIDRASKMGKGILIHKVQSGDTLESLALKYYHNKAKWTLIYRANKDQFSETRELHPGQVLKIPVESGTAATGEPSSSKKNPAASGSRAGSPGSASRLEKPTEGQVKIHVVQPGETFGSLALRYYKTETKWNLIYEANKDQVGEFKSPKVGQRLVIPTDPESARAVGTDKTTKNSISKKMSPPAAAAPSTSGSE